MSFDGMTLLYIPEGHRYKLTLFANITSVTDYMQYLDFKILRENLYFSIQEFEHHDEIFYIAPNFFSPEELTKMFVSILPEEVDI
jgi:hypothetical protein